MSRKSAKPEPEVPAIKKVVGQRPLRDRVAEALRDTLMAGGLLKGGKWSGLADMAQERWRVHADTFIEKATKLKVTVANQEEKS